MFVHIILLLFNTIVFNTKVVIIYWYVVFILYISIIFYLPQIIHFIATFSAVFSSTTPGLYQHLILNIENSFKIYGTSFLSFSILYAVNSIIPQKGNQWRLSFMYVGQYSVLLLRSIFFSIDGNFTSWFRLF